MFCSDVRDELQGIDLVWWPTLLRCASYTERRERDRLVTHLRQLALAVVAEED
jgi:hypothetical protein